MKNTLSLFASALLLAIPQAHAYDPANPCNLPSPPPPVVYTDFLDNHSVSCVPWPWMGPFNTQSTPYTLTKTPGGTVIYWYCHGDNGKWGYTLGVVTNEELTANPDFFNQITRDLAAATLASPTIIDGVNAVANKYVTKPLNDETVAAAWCPVWQTLWNNWPEPKNLPAPVGHLVVATPTYILSKDQSSLTLLRSTVPIGKTCSCPPVIPVINKKMYCTFPGAIAANVVAECY